MRGAVQLLGLGTRWPLRIEPAIRAREKGQHSMIRAAVLAHCAMIRGMPPDKPVDSVSDSRISKPFTPLPSLSY